MAGPTVPKGLSLKKNGVGEFNFVNRLVLHRAICVATTPDLSVTVGCGKTIGPANIGQQ